MARNGVLPKSFEGWGVEGGERAGNRGKVQAYDKSFTYVTDNNNNRYHLQSTNHFAKQNLMHWMNRVCVCVWQVCRVATIGRCRHSSRGWWTPWAAAWCLQGSASPRTPHPRGRPWCRAFPPSKVATCPSSPFLRASSSLLQQGEYYMPQHFPASARWVLHATALPWFSKVSATCPSSSLIHPGECYMPQQFPAPHVPSTVTGSLGGGNRCDQICDSNY